MKITGNMAKMETEPTKFTVNEYIRLDNITVKTSAIVTKQGWYFCFVFRKTKKLQINNILTRNY